MGNQIILNDLRVWLIIYDFLRTASSPIKTRSRKLNACILDCIYGLVKIKARRIFSSLSYVYRIFHDVMYHDR